MEIEWLEPIATNGECLVAARGREQTMKSKCVVWCGDPWRCRTIDRHAAPGVPGPLGDLGRGSSSACPFRLRGLLQSVAYTPGFAEAFAVRASRPAGRRSCRHSPSWLDCITDTSGYNFRKGQDLHPRAGRSSLRRAAYRPRFSTDSRTILSNSLVADDHCPISPPTIAGAGHTNQFCAGHQQIDQVYR